ncbi:MAG: response regulator [bacterium]|nr:response regulator [bacterium]
MPTPLKVLIVEDSPDDAVLMLRELKRGGYDPDHERVDTPEGMAAALDGRQWDVILSDYALPSFSAPKALECLHGRRLDIPFIIVSGSIGEEIAVEAMKAGAHDYFSKDNLVRLVPAVEREIRQAAERRERRRIATERDRIFSLSTDMLCIAGFDGYFKQVNPAFTRTLGWLREEMLQKRLADLAHPDDREATAAAEERLRRGEALFLFENRCRCRDGTYRWISWNAISFPRDALVIAVARDMTSKKADEEKIRLLAKFPDENPRPVLRVSLDGDILYANPAARPLLDAWGTAAGGHIPDDWRDFARETFQGGATLVRESMVGNRSFTATFTPIVDAAYVNIYAADVTEHRRIEQQLLQLQKLEAVGTLAGGLAHDFNNILSGIIGYITLVRSRVARDGEARADLDTMEKLAWRGSDLTNSLLAFARKSEYHPDVLDINKVVEEVLKVVGRTAGGRVKMENGLDPGLPRVLGDKGQCHQVIMNLCLNACDAMPEGGTLSIRTSAATPSGEFRRTHPRMKAGPHVRVSIADTGIGMDRETLDRIFEPFFTTKTMGRGRGLGLSMVSGIVERHGGGIDVESEQGKGSTFHIFLPATAESEEREEPRPAVILGGGETIMVVDDDPTFRDVAGRYLGGLGYTVLEATSGEEALALLREGGRKTDLILLDMLMPKEGGAETYLKMKREFPDVPVIICTGFSLDYNCRRALDEGAVDFIQKPFDPGVLSLKIRSVLENR